MVRGVLELEKIMLSDQTTIALILLQCDVSEDESSKAVFLPTPLRVLDECFEPSEARLVSEISTVRTTVQITYRTSNAQQV